MTNKIIMSLLVNTAVFSALFCAALLIKKIAGKKISPVIMLLLWAVVVIKLVIPFGFESSLSLLPAPAAGENRAAEYTPASGIAAGDYAETDNDAMPVSYNADTPVIQPEQNIEADVSTAESRSAAAAGVDWTAIALCVWAAGTAAVGAALCLSVINLKRRIKHARIDTPPYIPGLAEECGKELGIRRKIRIVVQSALDKPVIMGAVKPLLVLPENAGQLGGEALRHVLLHELTHFKGGDLWAIKFMNILRAFYWFNPLVWVCFRIIREDIELACDHKVIKALGLRHRLSYIETVLIFTGRKPVDRFAAAMGLFDGRPVMERRINNMYGKMKTGIRGRIAAGLIAVLIFAVSALTACQPAAVNAIDTERVESKWEYSKDYGSGSSLSVNAAVYSVDAGTLPTLTVIPEFFESGEQIKAITDLFCPDARIIYEQGGKFTVEQLEQAIAEAKQEGLTDVVAYYEQQLPEATGSLEEASYQLIKIHDGSMQANMIAESDGSTSYIDFANWDSVFDEESEYYSSANSAFLYESDLFISDNAGTKDCLVTPESLNGDSGYVKAKEKADGYVRDMGIDYMTLNSVSSGEVTYGFYYTRTYNGLPETYVRTHTGTTVTGVDGAPSIILWDAEYLYIVIQDGNVVKASWENPSDIKSVDNGNTQMLPFEQIKQIFLSAMDDMMTLKPREKAAGTNAYAPLEGTEVVINRVELGYTKLLTEGTKDDYKLVPTWMFMGYEKNEAYQSIHVSENRGAEMCIVTINAIDGTLIDRGQGL